jgi:hypothetical protein
LTAADLSARYADNLSQIRLGFIVSLIAVVFYLPWTAVLSAQMARIEGKFPVLSFLQLLGGGLTVMVVSFSAFFWVAAAFRPERAPALIQLLTDLGWLCWYTIASVYMIKEIHRRISDAEVPAASGRFVQGASA